jgi:hypothetical protein
MPTMSAQPWDAPIAKLEAHYTHLSQDVEGLRNELRDMRFELKHDIDVLGTDLRRLMLALWSPMAAALIAMAVKVIFFGR